MAVPNDGYYQEVLMYAQLGFGPALCALFWRCRQYLSAGRSLTVNTKPRFLYFLASSSSVTASNAKRALRTWKQQIKSIMIYMKTYAPECGLWLLDWLFWLSVIGWIDGQTSSRWIVWRIVYLRNHNESERCTLNNKFWVSLTKKLRLCLL